MNSVSHKMVDSQEDPCEKFEKLIVSLINKSLEEINLKEEVAQVKEEQVVQEQVPQEEVAQLEEQVPQEQEPPVAPVQVEEQLSEEFVNLVESLPETSHTLIAYYDSY